MKTVPNCVWALSLCCCHCLVQSALWDAVVVAQEVAYSGLSINHKVSCSVSSSPRPHVKVSLGNEPKLVRCVSLVCERLICATSLFVLLVFTRCWKVSRSGVAC